MVRFPQALKHSFYNSQSPKDAICLPVVLILWLCAGSSDVTDICVNIYFFWYVFVSGYWLTKGLRTHPLEAQRLKGYKLPWHPKLLRTAAHTQQFTIHCSFWVCTGGCVKHAHGCMPQTQTACVWVLRPCAFFTQPPAHARLKPHLVIAIYGRLHTVAAGPGDAFMEALAAVWPPCGCVYKPNCNGKVWHLMVHTTPTPVDLDRP